MISKVQATMSPGLFVYREHLGSVGANFRVDLDNRINVTVSPLLARSKHVVYTNIVEALLRLLWSTRVICCCIPRPSDSARRRSCSPRRPTLARLAPSCGSFRSTRTTYFLSDDMTIINGEGEARSFPKPPTISSHTMRAVNTKVLSLPRRLVLGVQSRIHPRGRQFALLLARLNIPIIAINAITQILVPPPKYMVDRLVPTARYRDTDGPTDLHHRPRTGGRGATVA